MNIECVTLIGLDDALEDRVALGHRLQLNNLQLALLYILAIAVEGVLGHDGTADERNDGSEVFGQDVRIGSFVQKVFAEYVTAECYLLHEIGIYQSIALL